MLLCSVFQLLIYKQLQIFKLGSCRQRTKEENVIVENQWYDSEVRQADLFETYHYSFSKENLFFSAIWENKV